VPFTLSDRFLAEVQLDAKSFEIEPRIAESLQVVVDDAGDLKLRNSSDPELTK
jgi:hypothetical protein